MTFGHLSKFTLAMYKSLTPRRRLVGTRPRSEEMARYNAKRVKTRTKALALYAH